MRAGFMDRGSLRDAVTFALIMFSMAACIPLFFLGPMAFNAGLSLGQALAAALVGNLVVAVAIALNGHAGVAWRVDYPEQAVWVFGRIGSKIAVALRGFVGALWYGVEAFSGALALAMILVYYAYTGYMHASLDANELVDTALKIVPLALAFYIALLAVVLSRGAEGLSKAANIAGPLLLLYFAWLLFHLESQETVKLAPPSQAGVAWTSAAFLTYLAIQTNWWATVAVNASDLTKAARRWSSVWFGVIVGLVGGQVLGTYIGYRLAQLTGVVLPHEMIIKGAPSALAVILGLAFVFLAPWTTDLTANAPALADLVRSVTRLDYRKAAVVTAALGFILAPWWAFDRAEQIVDYVSGFAAAYGVILGPILGPMLAAYWIQWRGKPPITAARNTAAALAAMIAGIAASYMHSVLEGIVQQVTLASITVPFPAGPTWYTGVIVSILAYLAIVRMHR